MGTVYRWYAKYSIGTIDVFMHNYWKIAIPKKNIQIGVKINKITFL